MYHVEANMNGYTKIRWWQISFWITNWGNLTLWPMVNVLCARSEYMLRQFHPRYAKCPVGGHRTLILRSLRCRGRETGMQWWSKRREMTWASSITKALMFDENMNDMNKKYLWISCRTLDGLIFSLSWGSLLVDINETKIPCTSHICVLLWYSFFARSNARVRT